MTPHLSQTKKVQAFFVPGPLPALNEFAGRGPYAYREAKKEWAITVAYYIKLARVQPMPRVFIRWTWYEKDQRRDPDNFTFGKKFVLDALVACGVLLDDGWDEIAGMADAWCVNAAKPGVLVELEAA